MDALQAITNHGGWPMSLFLTPEGHPFFGGTYFPPVSSRGMPSFQDLLTAIVDAWRNRRQEIMEGSNRLVGELQRHSHPAIESSQETELQTDTLDSAVQGILAEFDDQHGGWGEAPKFPHPMVLEFLLRHHRRTGDQEVLAMATMTLESMARGGIYDQLGGGFHRYSVDDHWSVPHFEKMLYDNAQLARVYTHAWQATGEPFFRTIAEETLGYVVREMTHPEGGFYSTQDADSEGEEGKYYLWTSDEIRVLLDKDASPFMKAHGVTAKGNFDGKNTLTFRGPLVKRERFASARSKLLEARQLRVAPARDEKVLTSWNGLMLAAFAEAARAFGREDYRQVAERNADFLLRELRGPDGRLRHSWRDGVAKNNSYLEDYALLIDGLIELYQSDFDPVWFLAARSLTEIMVEDFAAPTGFFDTPEGHEALIFRPRELQDNAVPSGNSMAAFDLLRMAGLAVYPGYWDTAFASIAAIRPLLGAIPPGLRPVADSHGLRPLPSPRDRDPWGAPIGGHPGAAGGGNQRLPPAPGRGLSEARHREEGCPTVGGAGTHRWPCNRLRLRRLNLPATGHRPGGATSPVGRAIRERPDEPGATEERLVAHPT